MDAFYNLHDTIKIRVESGKLGLEAGYDHYLRYFRSAVTLPEVNYEVNEFAGFHLPENYVNVGGALGFPGGICFPAEKYAIVLADNKITEYTTYPNRATNLWLQLLLLRRGKSFIHGAGVEINGQGIVFPAYGGTGKTILISELRKLPNCQVFGDDYVIVDQQARMYSYPSDFSIYPYHLVTFPELASSEFSRYLEVRKIFSAFYFVKKTINYLWRRWSKNGVPLWPGWTADYVKVPAVKLIGADQIGRQTQLKAAVFLNRYNGHEMQVEEISLDQLVQLTDGILWLESQHALPYLSALAASGLIDLANVATRQREVLRNCFAPLKLLRVNIPQKMDAGTYVQYMAQLIQTNLL